MDKKTTTEVNHYETTIIIKEQYKGDLIIRTVSENDTIYYQQVSDMHLKGTHTFLDDFLERFNTDYAADEQTPITEVLLEESHIHIKRLKPAQNRCIRLFQRLQIFFSAEPLLIEHNASPCKLLQSLVRRAYIPWLVDMIQNITTLQSIGGLVLIERLPTQNKNEVVFEHSHYYAERLISQTRLKLLLLNDEIVLSFFQLP